MVNRLAQDYVAIRLDSHRSLRDGVVLFKSRNERWHPQRAERLARGRLLSSFLAAITCFFFATISVVVLTAHAGDPAEVLPKEPRDAAIESPAAFFGFPIGSRHLRHDQVVSYWRYLEQASDRVRLVSYGESHGRRPMMMAVITSPKNLERLDRIRRARRQLTTGRYTGDLKNEPLVMYLGYSVHGDEASAVNAAPLVAFHLASSKSETVLQGLNHSIYLVDPALNPDGIDRFANWANEVRGKFASPSSVDREHVQPWPGGRTNYYWFDLNRDWLPLVHPESRGRLRLFHQWKPNVVLDFHEMSGNSSFFFQPGIPARNNPLSPPQNLALTRAFAAEHARSMDAAGETYFTEERFDDFYVGKGSTYPDLHGAVGILFEQGSTRGLRLRNDRTDRHFRDTVANQVRTSLSSLRAANENRLALLEYQTSFYRSALDAGRQDSTTAFVLTGSPSRIDAAADLMTRHAIEVFVPEEGGLLLAGQRYAAAETLVVPCNQPEYYFVRSLMEPMQSFRENIFYDVSTWHLPSAFDLELHRVESDLPPAWTTKAWRRLYSAAGVDADPQPFDTNSEQIDQLAGFAFEPVELEAPALAVALQRAGASLRVATKEFETDQEHAERKSWPRGTFLLLRQPNQLKWKQIVKALVDFGDSHNIYIQGLDSSLTPSGPDLGSDTALDIPRCKPLLVVGDGTSAYSAGNIWHYLDRRIGQPSTLAEADRIAGIDLRDYSCVILPSGSYGTWSKMEADALQAYVRGGGTVVAVASAIRWLSSRGLVSLNLGEAAEEPEDTQTGGSPSFGEASDDRALESIAGAFLQVQVDPSHPLAFGFPDRRIPVFRDHSLRFPTPSNPYQLAAQYESILAGYVSERNRNRLLGSAAVWAQSFGSGRYILLADNPVFRGYVRSSERFLSNAILLGPALDIPAPPVD